MTHKPYVVGQSKTVLVFGEDENATAVISTIRARVIRGNAQTPLRFSGPVAFDAQTAEHIRTVVLPLAGEILSSLGVPMPSFEASVANVGAASSQDIGMRVTGFSADTSIFLALLSSALRLPVPKDIVATGHIGSAAGDVRMVRSLRAKVEAASADQDVRLSFILLWTKICPSTGWRLWNSTKREALSPPPKDTAVRWALAISLVSCGLCRERHRHPLCR